MNWAEILSVMTIVVVIIQGVAVIITTKNAVSALKENFTRLEKWVDEIDKKQDTHATTIARQGDYIKAHQEKIKTLCSDFRVHEIKHCKDCPGTNSGRIHA